MPGFLSRLSGRHREAITIRARKAVISGNVLNDINRPIHVEADEVVLLGNKATVSNQYPVLPWHQRPVGKIVLTVIAGLILAGIVALAGTW